MANHSIVHVEIPANDPAKAGKFYTELFGWNVQADPVMNYHMFQGEPGPGGGFVKVGDGPTSQMSHKAGEVLIYVSTDDIDATLAKAQTLGSTVIMPKTEIPTVGWFGIFTDPTGNRIALFTNK